MFGALLDFWVNMKMEQLDLNFKMERRKARQVDVFQNYFVQVGDSLLRKMELQQTSQGRTGIMNLLSLGGSNNAYVML